LNDLFELPSLEQIEEMERQRLQAIESLEISGSSVKCQRYGTAVPIVGKLPRPHNERVAILQKRIKWMENYYHVDNVNDLKRTKTGSCRVIGRRSFLSIFSI
jgi:hypothetical protein